MVAGVNVIATTADGKYTLYINFMSDAPAYIINVCTGSATAANPTNIASTDVSGVGASSVTPVTADNIPTLKATAIAALIAQLTAYFQANPPTPGGNPVPVPTDLTTMLETALMSIKLIENADGSVTVG